jgi:polar amino acid transport system substrate-binding protein
MDLIMMKLVFISCLLFFINNVLAKEVLTFGYTEACPLMCPNQKDKGFTTEITKTVLEKSGYTVKFESLPWSRAVDFANKGTLSGLICTGQEESPLLIYPKLEEGIQNDCFYGAYSDKWKPNDLTSFINRKTIIFKGWVYEQKYKDKLGEKIYFKTFKEFSLEGGYFKRAIKMVQRGRAHAFWSDENMFKYFLKQNQSIKEANIVKKLGCIKRQKLYLGMSPKFPKLAKKVNRDFDKGMREIRKSGELDKIMAKYGLTDWE